MKTSLEGHGTDPQTTRPPVPTPGRASTPPPGSAPGPAVRAPPPGRNPPPSARTPPTAPGRRALGMHRLFIILGYVSVWLAIGFFTSFDYIGFLTGDLLFVGFLMIGLVFVVWLAMQDRAWLYLVAGFTAMIVPIMVLFVFGALSVIAEPFTGGEYLAILFLVLALLLTLPAAVAGFLARRRERAATPIRASWRTPHGVFAIAVVALILGMAITGTLASEAAKGIAGGGYDFEATEIGAVTHEVTIRDFEFHDMPTLAAGQPAEIVLTNEDGAFHTFTYERGGVEYNHDAFGGATIRFLVLFAEPGTIMVRCLPHSGGYEESPDDMVATMSVVEA